MKAPLKKIRTALSADGESIIIRGRFWRSTIPVATLAQEIAFYERLADRKGGKYRAHYAPTIDALKKIQNRIGKSA